jgi:hypothetical protein
MKGTLFFLIYLAVALGLEGRVADSINNVDLIVEDKINDKGQNIGDNYHVHNRNYFPITYTFKLTDSVNANNNINQKSGTIESYTIIPIGSITMDDLAEESLWTYELEVKPTE